MSGTGLTLRPADEQDEKRLLLWRNDPVTRQFAFDERMIPPEEHAAWFRTKLAEPESILLIAEDGGSPVGQVRLERIDQGAAEVHIAVAPEARGRGVATEMLRLAVQEAPSALGVSMLVARVKPMNVASLRLFRTAGFVVTSGGEAVVEFERPLGT